MQLSPVSTVSHIDFAGTMRFFNYSFFFVFFKEEEMNYIENVYSQNLLTVSLVSQTILANYLLVKKEHFKVTLTKCMKTI